MTDSRYSKLRLQTEKTNSSSACVYSRGSRLYPQANSSYEYFFLTEECESSSVTKKEVLLFINCKHKIEKMVLRPFRGRQFQSPRGRIGHQF